MARALVGWVDGLGRRLCGLAHFLRQFNQGTPNFVADIALLAVQQGRNARLGNVGVLADFFLGHAARNELFYDI